MKTMATDLRSSRILIILAFLLANLALANEGNDSSKFKYATLN